MKNEQLKAIEHIADKRYCRALESGEPETSAAYRIANMLRNKESYFEAKQQPIHSEWCRNLAEAYEVAI